MDSQKYQLFVHLIILKIKKKIKNRKSNKKMRQTVPEIRKLFAMLHLIMINRMQQIDHKFYF